MGYTGKTEEVTVVDIVVNDSKTGTWAAFVDNYLIYFDNKQSELKNEDELFKYQGNDVRILQQYNAQEKHKNNNQASKSLIKFGTLIKVPKTNLRREILPNAGNLAVSLNDVKLHMPPEVLAAFQSKGYAPLNTEDSKAGQTFLGNAYRVFNNMSVWCYCKALGADGEGGKMVNLTPFIDNLTTNVGENGGNFTISIAPITCEYDPKEGWVMTKGTYTEHAFKGKITALVRDSLLYQRDGQLKRKKFFFHHLIQPNDVVFIQFETLIDEKPVREFQPNLISQLSNFYPTQSPAGRIYDMIGLVDVAQSKYSPESSSVDIEITGRDFMKILIDDGCYIYPLDYARGMNPDAGPAVQRVLGKELYFFKSFVDVSVGYLANFVMNALSNIGVVKNDSVFSGWGERRSYNYQIKNDNVPDLSKDPVMKDKKVLDKGQVQSTDKVLKKLAEGIWQIVKLNIDPSVADLRLVDTSITDYQGSLLNYLNKVCQKPFAEFRGDTYGDQYYFSIIRPPFTQDAFLECFDKQGKITIEEDTIINEDLSFDDSDVYSWYRIRPAGSFVDKQYGDAMASELTVWLEEFAQLFGAKSYDIATIYGQIYNVDASVESLEELLAQFRNDLIYMIESTVYLPFTRKGTITICPGDRRIKRGMVIRHNGTDELFYVDNVANTAAVGNSSVERMTVLTVSRGMVEKYAKAKVPPSGKLGKYRVSNNLMSYFNLVDFGLELDKNTKGMSTENIKVNTQVLEFFLKRKQFIDNYSVGSKDF